MITVLLVEDDATFAYAAKRYLQSQGLHPVVAPGSMTALTTLGLQSVDIVVADVKLRPGEPHGLALARMIHHQQPRLPIILMTAYPELLEGEALPGPVMTKPVDLNDLHKAIRTALGAEEGRR